MLELSIHVQVFRVTDVIVSHLVYLPDEDPSGSKRCKL